MLEFILQKRDVIPGRIRLRSRGGGGDGVGAGRESIQERRSVKGQEHGSMNKMPGFESLSLVQ